MTFLSGMLMAKALYPFKSLAMTNRKQSANWSSVHIDEVNKERQQKGGPYLSFINKNTLKTGLYVLPKGSEDKQTPHELDEVYYVIEGSANFFVDGETIEAKAGDVIYVKAAIEHRFIDIKETLKILVFFSEVR